MAAESSAMATTGPTNGEMTDSPPEMMQYRDLLRSMKLNDSKDDLALLDRIGQWIHDRPRTGGSPAVPSRRYDAHSAVASSINGNDKAMRGGTSVTMSGSSSTDAVNNDKAKLVTSIIEEISASLLLQRLIRSFEQRNMPSAAGSGTVQLPPTSKAAFPPGKDSHSAIAFTATTTTASVSTNQTKATRTVPLDDIAGNNSNGDKTTESNASSTPDQSAEQTGTHTEDVTPPRFDAYFISDLGESRGAFSKVRHLKLSPRVLNSLLGVANDLVHTIPKLQEIVLKESEFQELTPTATVSVAQVATRCLESLLMQERIRKARKSSAAHGAATQDTAGPDSVSLSLYQIIFEFLKESPALSPSKTGAAMQNGGTIATVPMYQQQQTNFPNNNSTNDVTQKCQSFEQEDFKLTTFLTRTLLTIRRQAVQCVESSYDFDYLFQSSCNLPLVQKALQLQRNLDDSASVGEPSSDSTPPRATAWKIACAISLRQEVYQQRQPQQIPPSSPASKQSGNANVSSGGGGNQSASITMNRRQKLVVMAASLVIVYSLPQMISFAAATAATSSTHAPKAAATSKSTLSASAVAKSTSNGGDPKMDTAQFADSEHAQFDDAERDSKNTSQPEIHPAAKRPKLGHASEAAKSTLGDDKMEIEIVPQPDDTSESQDEDLVDMIVQATNRLCTYLAWASLEKDEIHPVSRSEVETQLFGLVRDFGTLPLVQGQPIEPPLSSPFRKWPHATFWTLLQRSISRPRFLQSHLVAAIEALNRDTMGRYTLPSSSTSLEMHPLINHPHYQLPVAVVPFLRCQEFLIQGGDQSDNALPGICPIVSHRPYSRNYIVAVVPKDRDSIHKLVQQITDRVSSAITGQEPAAKTPGTPENAAATADEFGEGGPNVDAHSPEISPAPPLMTDVMELNEWTISVVSLSVVKPSKKLMKLLGSKASGSQNVSSKPLRTIIAPLLNRALVRIHQDITLAPARQQQNEVASRGNYLGQKATAVCPVTIGPNDGHVYVECDEIAITPDIQLCASVIGLYYHALEAILQDEFGRFQDGNAQQSQTSSSAERNGRLIRSPAFHRALLVCCYTCVLKAVGASSNQNNLGKRKRMVMVKLSPKHDDLTIYSLLKTMESTPYAYLKVTEAFVRALTPELKSPLQRGGSSSLLGSPILFGLPQVLQHHIKQTEIHVIDSIVWSRDLHLHFRAPDMEDEEGTVEEESLCHAIGVLRASITPHSEWPPESLEPDEPEELENLGMTPRDKSRKSARRPSKNQEANFVSYVFRKILKISKTRIQAICQGLGIPSTFPIANEAWIAFRYLVRQHVEVLFDRHVDQFILCCIYGICKMMKLQPDVSFTRIIDVYVSVRARDLGERSCQRVVRHIKLLSVGQEDQSSSKRAASKNGKLPKPIGDIIDFYNRVFIPKMKRHFLKAKSIKRNSAVLSAKMRSQNLESVASLDDAATGIDGDNQADNLSPPSGSVGSVSLGSSHENGNNRIVSPAGPNRSSATTNTKQVEDKNAAEGIDVSTPVKNNGEKEFVEAPTPAMNNVAATE